MPERSKSTKNVVEDRPATNPSQKAGPPRVLLDKVLRQGEVKLKNEKALILVASSINAFTQRPDGLGSDFLNTIQSNLNPERNLKVAYSVV